MITTQLPSGWNSLNADSIDRAQYQKRSFDLVDSVRSELERVADQVLLLDGSAQDFSPAKDRVIALGLTHPGTVASDDADLTFDPSHQHILAGEVRAHRDDGVLTSYKLEKNLASIHYEHDTVRIDHSVQIGANGTLTQLS